MKRVFVLFIYMSCKQCSKFKSSVIVLLRESALRPTTLTPQVLCCVLPCDEHGHYRHGFLRSNYALFHPNVHPPLCPRCSIADLGELTSASPLPIREGYVCNHYLRIGLVAWHWVAVSEALMKHPRGELAQQGCC